MGIMAADPYLTMRAIAGRPLLRIKCCKVPMMRKDVTSHQKGSQFSFAYSEVILICRKCRREIDADFFLGKLTKEDMWEEVERDEYPEVWAKNINKARDNGPVSREERREERKRKKANAS